MLRNIGTNAFFSLSFEVFFLKSRLVFFIVRPAIIKKKKKHILMTQRAEGIRVEKMEMPNLIKLWSGREGWDGLFTGAE